jgi:hypothetical protein
VTTPATDTPATDKKMMTLPELRKFEGQLFIMNCTPKFMTFNSPPGAEPRVSFELEPAGEVDSIAFLPKAALDMRGLQKLWMKGEIIISTDPEMEEQIMLLNAKSVGMSQERMNAILGVATENANHKDIVEKPCLVCGQYGRDQYNQPTNVIARGRVLQSRRQVKEGTPPLCEEHVGEAHNYVPRLVSERGEEHWEFDSVKLGAAQR